MVIQRMQNKVIRKIGTVVPGQRRRSRLSVFGDNLVNNRRVKIQYDIKTLSIKSIINKGLNNTQGIKPELFLFQRLEARLKTVVWRSGLATSVRAAAQLVSHKNITVNGGIVNVGSYIVKPNDVIMLNPKLNDNSHVKASIAQANTPEHLVMTVGTHGDTKSYSVKMVRNVNMVESRNMTMSIDFLKLINFFRKSCK